MLKLKLRDILLGLTFLMTVPVALAVLGCSRGYSQSADDSSSAKSSSPAAVSETIKFLPAGNEYSVSDKQTWKLEEAQGTGEVLATCKIAEFDQKEMVIEVKIVIENNSDQNINLVRDGVSILMADQVIEQRNYECSTDRILYPKEVTGCRVFFLLPENSLDGLKVLKVTYDVEIGSTRKTFENHFEVVI